MADEGWREGAEQIPGILNETPDAVTEEEFWNAQDAAEYWTVPIAHGGSMPWLKTHERGLLVAIDRAHRRGKTVLLVDSSEDKVVDTFYAYQAALVLEAKRMVLDVAKGTRSKESVLEDCRVQLVNAMRYGKVLYIRLGDSACDFCSQFSDDATFPLAIFDRAVVASLAEYKEGGPSNLWKSDHPLASVLRRDDLMQGELFQPRFAHKSSVGDGAPSGFEVVVCTNFPADEFAEYLTSALPMPLLQPIKPLPSSVRCLYSHYDRLFELEVGGTLSWGAIDDVFALSFVFKGQFRPSLVPMAARKAEPRAAPSRGPQRGPQARGGGATMVACGEPIDRDSAGLFHGLRGGAVYQLVVAEDDAAEAEARGAEQQGSGGRPVLSAAALASTQLAAAKLTQKAKPMPGRSDDGSTQTAALLADELRRLSTEEVAERSARYRALREAADLQDVVFGGSA